MAATTRSVKRRASLSPQHPIYLSHSSGQRQTAFKTLRQRQLVKKSSRQVSSPEPQTAPRRIVLGKVPAAPRRLEILNRAARRQLSTPGPSSPVRPQSSPPQAQPIHLPSLECPIGLSKERGNNRTIIRRKSIPNQRSIRHNPRLRRSLSNLQRRLESDITATEEIPRIIWHKQDMPAEPEGMARGGRKDFVGAVRDGSWSSGFDKSQLAYAAMIARSKPPMMDVGWFVDHLLKRTHKDRRIVTNQRLSFNGIEYWKEINAMLMREKHDIKGENESLRIKLKRVEAELKAERAKDSFTSSPCRTGMGGSGDEAQPERHSETQYGTPDGVDTGYPDIQNANDVLELNAPHDLPAICYGLLREARSLHGLLSDPTVTPTRLQTAILRTVGIIADVLESITKPDPEHFRKAILRQTFRLASSTMNICLQALSHLCRDISGRKNKGQVLYQICTVFKFTLEDNKKLCHKVADEAYQVYRDHLPLAQRRMLSGLEIHEVDVPYLISCRTEFLASIFLGKELAKTPRPTCFVELLEGLSAELYTKVGNLISKTVFKEQVTNSHLPGSLTLIPVDGRADEVKELAVAIERDQILKMLRAIVNRLSTAATKDGVENGPADHLAQLISTEKLLVGVGNYGRSFKIAKQRLQQTLCKAIFGKDNGEFAQALKLTTWDDEWGDVLTGGRKEKIINDDGEAFVQGIWELVGWDLLEEI